jgi:hypothetical protein
VAIGLAGLVTAPARAAAGAGLRATAPVWRPVADPLARRGEAIENALLDALSGPITDELVQMLLERQVVERVIADVLADETLERLLAIIEQQQVATRVGESQLVAAISAQISMSQEVLDIVGAIARSPVVREALAAQSTGMVTDVADQVRGRTAGADDTLERVARRLLRRPRQDAPTVELPESS